MRIYSASSEESLGARKLLTEWASEGLLSQTQGENLKQETVSDLRTTNFYLRLILFFFTLVGVGASVALFCTVFGLWSSEHALGVCFLIFAGLCYGGAELAVSRARLYRYGIEEALATCSVGFLCAGLEEVLFSGGHYSPKPNAMESLVPAAGIAASLWIWRRFGLWYAFPAAMVLALFLPGHWTSSHSAQHMLVVLLFGIGLIGVVTMRARHDLDSSAEDFAIAEAFLWLGIYVAINLQLSALNVRAQWWNRGATVTSGFPKTFYWTTWVLIWCLPPAVLARGIRLKDRFVMAVGAIVAVLTLISNKPYLGWPRHTWDPMLLGIVLVVTALWIRRLLASGPGGVRGGFTAARVSGRDTQWMNTGSVVLGLATAHSVTPSAHPKPADFRFGGGATGGGGAGGDF